MKSYAKFEAEIYVLSEAEGGRHKPFRTGYAPQFFFRTADLTGTVKLPQATEMCMPGDNVTLNIDLISEVVMEKGERFAIREGGRTVGRGIITKVSA
jgi:elongation factor Tu